MRLLHIIDLNFLYYMKVASLDGLLSKSDVTYFKFLGVTSILYRDSEREALLGIEYYSAKFAGGPYSFDDPMLI